jgi:hypothetical protein
MAVAQEPKLSPTKKIAKQIRKRITMRLVAEFPWGDPEKLKAVVDCQVPSPIPFEVVDVDGYIESATTRCRRDLLKTVHDPESDGVDPEAAVSPRSDAAM